MSIDYINFVTAWVVYVCSIITSISVFQLLRIPVPLEYPDNLVRLIRIGLVCVLGGAIAQVFETDYIIFADTYDYDTIPEVYAVRNFWSLFYVGVTFVSCGFLYNYHINRTI